VTSVRSPGPAARGIVRLLNTADGRALCLAGDVDAAAVDSFLQRYGREPARIDRIDAGSVTALSAQALDLVLDHLDAAERAGRPVAVCRSPHVERLLADARGGISPG
jgi:anti-anti-sigma regulatory factor